MAEAFLNAKFGDRYEAFSAGTEPGGAVDPYAIKAMHEVGIDISKNRVKSVDEFIRAKAVFDYVVTTCPEARQSCPYFPAPEQLHVAFDDPQTFYGTEEEKMARTRAVRDQIANWVEGYFGPRHRLEESEEGPVGQAVKNR